MARLSFLGVDYFADVLPGPYEGYPAGGSGQRQRPRAVPGGGGQHQRPVPHRGCGGRGTWANSTSTPWTSASGRASASSIVRATASGCARYVPSRGRPRSTSTAPACSAAAPTTSPINCTVQHDPRQVPDRRTHDARGEHEHGARLLRGGETGVLRRLRRARHPGVSGLPDAGTDEQLQRSGTALGATGPRHGKPALQPPVDRPVVLRRPAGAEELREGGYGDGGRGEPRGSLSVRPAGSERMGVEADQGQV